MCIIYIYIYIYTTDVGLLDIEQKNLLLAILDAEPRAVRSMMAYIRYSMHVHILINVLYVCIYIYAYTHMYIHTHYICVYIYIYIHVYM